jgi:hypothetical protein
MRAPCLSMDDHDLVNRELVKRQLQDTVGAVCSLGSKIPIPVAPAPQPGESGVESEHDARRARRFDYLNSFAGEDGLAALLVTIATRRSIQPAFPKVTFLYIVSGRTSPRSTR